MNFNKLSAEDHLFISDDDSVSDVQIDKYWTFYLNIRHN